jgi:alpha-glucosidase (family GH31 glycosyl hydrolase)
MSARSSRSLLLPLIIVPLAACSKSPPAGRVLFESPDGFRRVIDHGESLHIETGAFAIDAFEQPFRIVAQDDRGQFFAEASQDQGTLYFVRNGSRVRATTATLDSADKTAVRLRVDLSDGGHGTITLSSMTPNAVSVEMACDDPRGVTHWGETLFTPADELIYGLTERTVDSIYDSEIEPKAVGSLNRKGETVKMYTTFTFGGYVPFHQSSKGYGLLIDKTMPGNYDIGVARADELSFEFEIDPGFQRGRYVLFHGPGHYEILNQYTLATGRPFLPPRFMFLHWKGRDELVPGSTVAVDGTDINPSLADDLEGYARYGIPVGVYHFDRPWAVGQEGYGDFVFDPARFPNAASMLRMMRARGWHIDVWQGPWAIGQRGVEAKAGGYLAPGADREIDFTNPASVAWLKNGLRAFLSGTEGSSIDAFFLDRGDEFQPSSAQNIYHDGENGRQIHNAYPLQYARIYREVLDEMRGPESYAFSRAYFAGEQQYSVLYGGDTHNRNGIDLPETPNNGPATDNGLRSALISLQRCAFMGIPWWGSNIGGISEIADRENFARWIEAGAAMPLMYIFGKGAHAPWEMATSPHFDQELLDIYRRYVRLHHALADYQFALAQQAHETGAPLARPLVFDHPDDPRALDRWDEWMLGSDLLVAPVWQSGSRARSVYLPAGKWIDFWDRTRTIQGPTEIQESVPLDRLPLYVVEGSSLLAIDPPQAQ